MGTQENYGGFWRTAWVYGPREKDRNDGNSDLMWSRTHLIPWLFAALVGVTTPAQAQVPDETNTQMSLGYEYRRSIKEHLRGFGDIVYEERYDPDFLFGSQNNLSTTGGVSYDVNKRIRLEGGLGLYYTYRPDLQDTFETRLWQAATLDWPDSLGVVRRYVLSHRFRIEERFSRTGDWSFALRFRYRLAFKFALNRYTIEPGAFYIPVKAEFFVPLGDDLEELFTKQARYSAGLGYVFDKAWTLELRYARQELRDTIDADLRTTDHFIELRLKSSFRIIDLLKGR
jgi:hypothetical protein